MKHKSLISGLGYHLAARNMQQKLLYEHQRAQFADRVKYWQTRGESRNRGLTICLIQDGMDQAKFAIPRGRLLRAKCFEKLNRPRLHLVGVLAHGHHVGLYLSEADLTKDSNTSAEIFAHTMSVCARRGVDLSTCNIVLQADNTVREIKNGILMRLCASWVSDGLCSSATMSFLRSGCLPRGFSV